VKTLMLADRTVSTKHPAFVMGIVNATPDSFWEKSRGGGDNALRLIDEGADILDIGGESTRPGAAYVSAEEEIKRIIPVIMTVRKYSSVPISVDTRKKEVLRVALDAGADILNDISALEDDMDIGLLAAEKKIPIILMHKRGIPAIMQFDTVYDDVFDEVNSYLCNRIQYALNCGVTEDHIIIDPGIGFGKKTDANTVLIRRCGELCDGRYPVLMALSRKTCIGDLTGQPVESRLAGTLAADIIAVLSGASIVRVHDVRETVDTLSVLGGIIK
jgi:dihydropteroate synthase